MQDVLIQEVMTKKPITVNCNEIVTTVAKIFKENNFHHVLVVDDEGRLDGIISHTDMDRTISGVTLFRNPRKEEHDAAILRSIQVCDIMTKEVVIVNSTDSIRKAYEIFKNNNFRALPVVSGKKLAGIITPIDILDHFFNL